MRPKRGEASRDASDFDSFAWMKGGGLCMPGADPSARLPYVVSRSCADYHMPDCGTDPCTIAPLIGMPLVLNRLREARPKRVELCASVILSVVLMPQSAACRLSINRTRMAEARRAKLAVTIDMRNLG